MDVGPTFYWEFPYFGMATGLPVLFCKTVVPVLDSAVLIRPAGTGDSGLRLCGAGGVDPPAVCSDSRGEGDASETGCLCGGAGGRET